MMAVNTDVTKKMTLVQFDSFSIKPEKILECEQINIETDILAVSVAVNADGSLSLHTRCKSGIHGDGAVILPRSSNAFDLLVAGNILRK